MKATVIYFANPTKVEQDKVVITRDEWCSPPLTVFDPANHVASIYVDGERRHVIRDIIRVEEIGDYVEPEVEPLPEIAPARDNEIPF